MAVTARVVEVERGFVLWAQRFQSSAADLFDLQAKLSASLAEVLTLEEHSHRGGSGPADRENVDSFLRAQHALGEWTSHGCETAVHLLENAHQISPRDPLLMAWLALARFRSWYLLDHASEGVATGGLRLPRLALDITENLGEEHLGRSIYPLYNASWIVAARRALERARLALEGAGDDAPDGVRAAQAALANVQAA